MKAWHRCAIAVEIERRSRCNKVPQNMIEIESLSNMVGTIDYRKGSLERSIFDTGRERPWLVGLPGGSGGRLPKDAGKSGMSCMSGNDCDAEGRRCREIEAKHSVVLAIPCIPQFRALSRTILSLFFTLCPDPSPCLFNSDDVELNSPAVEGLFIDIER